jgi:XTP/dITP diphosphohydrolase
MPVSLLLATRNAHKLEEIRDLIRDASVSLVSLDDAGVERHPAEEGIEIHDSFEGNALAKARYYRSLTGMATLADDSGLCVDALGGGPGIHSRRFAPDAFRAGRSEDAANNAWLLHRLAAEPAERRGAHYRCALALVDERRSLVVNGFVFGSIARQERGPHGFGYDPLFVPEGEELSFGQLAPEVKAAGSHRADAVRRLIPWLS